MDILVGNVQAFVYGMGVEKFDQIAFKARPDSIIYKAGIINENNGTRTPIKKAYNGKAAGLIAVNCEGNSYGGNWIATIVDILALIKVGAVVLLLRIL